MSATSTTSSSTRTSTTTIPLTTVFTPPTQCATDWQYEPSAYNDEFNGLLLQNVVSVVSSCFPTGFAMSGRAQVPQVYSPGWCPVGYTSADVHIDGKTTSAVCCYSCVTSLSGIRSNDANSASQRLFVLYLDNVIFQLTLSHLCRMSQHTPIV